MRDEAEARWDRFQEAPRQRPSFTDRGTRDRSGRVRAARPAEAVPAVRAPRRSRGARACCRSSCSPRGLDRHLRLRRLPLHRRDPRLPARRGRAHPRPNGRYLGRIDQRAPRERAARAIPLHVRAAFLATEDRRFYEHNGLDWRSAARAAACATCATAACAKGSARSPCRWRATPSSLNLRAGAHAAPQADRAAPRRA